MLTRKAQWDMGSGNTAGDILIGQYCAVGVAVPDPDNPLMGTGRSGELSPGAPAGSHSVPLGCNLEVLYSAFL